MTDSRVEEWFEEIENQYFPDWHSNKNRPVYLATEQPIMFMAKKNPEGQPRNYGNIRMDALASPTGYKPGEHHSEKPIANWMSHWHKPETYETIKNELFPNAENIAIYMTETARNNMKTKMKNYLQEDSDTAVINPIHIIDKLSDKESTYKHLVENNLPAIPTVEATKILYDGKTGVEQEIGETEDIGAMIKTKTGSGGTGVLELESLDEAQKYLQTPENRKELLEKTNNTNVDHTDPEKVASEYLIQAKIPHESDIRAITFGKKIGNAGRRISDEDSITTNIGNVSTKFDGEKLSIYGKALNALEQGRAESLRVNPEKLRSQDEKILGKGAADLAKDVATSFEYDESFERPPIALGQDLIEADIADVTHLPEKALDRALEYEDNGKVYFLPEVNHMFANTTDQMARVTGKPEQLSLVNLYDLMYEIATEDEFPEQKIIENDNSKVWRRTDQYFPEFQNKDQYKEAARANLR